MATATTGQELNDFTPDDVADMVEDPAFHQMPFAERQAYLERGLGKASGFLSAQEDWSPERYREFGDFAKRARSTVADSETVGEKLKYAGGVVGKTLVDSAAVAGTVALDAGVVNPDGSAKAPLQNVGQAFLNNVGKVVDSSITAVRQGFSGTDEALEGKLKGLRADLDAGEFPFEKPGFEAWLSERDKDLTKARESYFAAQRGTKEAPSEEVEYAARTGLQDKTNQGLLFAYMRTRSDGAWQALQDNLLKTRHRTQLESEEKDIQGGKLGGMMDDVFGEGASRYLSEAGDPMEWLGTILPLAKGAKVMKTAGALRKGMEVAKGIGAEMLSEQGSLFMDNPNATAEQRLQVAKDSALGAAGLLGVGAGVQKVASKFVVPAEVEATAPVREGVALNATGDVVLNGDSTAAGVPNPYPAVPLDLIPNASAPAPAGVLQQMAERQGAKVAAPGNTKAGTGPVPLPARGATALPGESPVTGRDPYPLVPRDLLPTPTSEAAAAATVALPKDGRGIPVTEEQQKAADGTGVVPLPAEEQVLEQEEVPMFIPKEEKVQRPTTEMHQWADERIQASRKGTRAVDQQEVIAAYAVKGASLIARGYRTFKTWSTKMLETWGSTVKEYLQGAWAAAVRTSRAGAIDVGQGGPLNRKAEDFTASGRQQTGGMPAAGQPGVKQRRFGQRVAGDERMHPKVQAGAVQEYVPEANAGTLAQANTIIDRVGVVEAGRLAQDMSAAMPGHVRVALGMQTMLRMDKAARDLRNAGDMAGASALWQRVGEVGNFVDSLGTSAGQAVQAFAMWARMTPEGLLRTFEKRVREVNKGEMPQLPDDLLDTLGELRDKINELPEGSPVRADLVREMLNEMALYEGIPIKSVFWALWYANLLSGVTTQGMNVVGNGWGLMLRSLAAGLVNHPQDSLRMLEGYMRGLPRAWVEAKAALQGKVDSRNLQDMPQVNDLVKRNALEILLSKPPSDFKSWVTWILSVGGLTKYVGRLMGGMDAAFYYTAAEGRAHLAASRAARKGAKPGTPEFVQAMADLLGKGAGAWEKSLQDAEAQLQIAGKPVTRAEKVRIAYAAMEASRATEIREEAGRFGELVTSQQEPEGIGASIYNVAKAFQEFPGGRFLLPFARTLANLFSGGLDFTPVGVVRALKGKHLTRESKPFAEWERWERGAAGVLGSVGAMVIWQMAMENKDDDDETTDFMIYGMGPRSAAARAQMPKGWKPFSIKIGDKYLPYAENPLVFILAPVGAIMDAKRYNKDLPDKSLEARFEYYAQTVLKTTMSQGVLSSMADLLGTINGEVKFSKLPSRITSGMIPGQGFLRDVTSLFDPVKIKDDSVASSILRDVPVARHWFGHPERDYMGDVIRYEGLSRIPVVKRFVTDQRTGDVDKSWVGRMQLSIPGFPPAVEVGDYLTKGEKLHHKASRVDAGMLTAAEQDEFVKRAGQYTRQAVQGMRRAYEARENQGGAKPAREELQKAMNNKVEAARRLAMRELMGK